MSVNNIYSLGWDAIAAVPGSLLPCVLTSYWSVLLCRHKWSKQYLISCLGDGLLYWLDKAVSWWLALNHHWYIHRTVVWLLLQHHLYGLRQQLRVYLQTLYCFKHLYSGLFQSRLLTLPGAWSVRESRNITLKAGNEVTAFTVFFLCRMSDSCVYTQLGLCILVVNILDPGYSLELRCFSLDVSIRTNLSLTCYATSVRGSFGRTLAKKWIIVSLNLIQGCKVPLCWLG